MKPAWHEVVASLETSLARGSNGLARGGNGVSSGVVGTNGRALPVQWHEPPVTHVPPPVAAPVAGTSRAELLGRLERRMIVDDDGIAIALLDLDGFKALNQEHGYAVGDRVLALTVERLEKAAGRSAAVARFGSDEFGVLLANVDPASALAVAERLVAAISEPMTAEGVMLRVTASVGVACRVAAQARPEDLVRDADRALSRARTLGGARAIVHDAVAAGRPLALAELEVALRRALDTDEFREHYQPIVSVKGGQVAGFEVHLWRRSGANGKRR